MTHRPIALITGGSRGLGRSMAEHLAARGTDVIITYQSNADAAAEVVAAIESVGAHGLALQLDVSDIGSFAEFATVVRRALPAFGPEKLSFLVNNAGTGVHAPVLGTSVEQFDAMMLQHVKGPLFLTQSLAPLLEDGGRILNVSTGLTRIILPGYGVYAAMKSAIETMTVYLAKELGERRIRVNVIAPGAIETDFGGGAVRDNAEINGFVAAHTALGRVGVPEDIGALVAMLLSPEAGWVNAQRIEASGGQHL